jgi:hypothetical protein
LPLPFLLVIPEGNLLLPLPLSVLLAVMLSAGQHPAFRLLLWRSDSPMKLHT